jgi:hypothetical protein
MKRFVEGVDRGQTTLFPECLEDWIGEDNPVRVVDVFVEELDLAELPDQNCYASTLPAKRFCNANITVMLPETLLVPTNSYLAFMSGRRTTWANE